MSDDHRTLLGPVLRDVSRSIYLSIRVLPRALGRPVGAAYLFARAADTIADTRALPMTERRRFLEVLCRSFDNPNADLHALQKALAPHQALPAERELLERLPELFAIHRELPDADREAIRLLMRELPDGMIMDLERFPPEESGDLRALETDADLDRYCYLVAGTAGAFWTRVSHAHMRSLRRWDLPAMIETGARYGKGLQLVNVLRDVPRDVRIGRCYLPMERLTAAGLRVEHVRDPGQSARFRPVLCALAARGLDYLDEGQTYVRAIPRTEWRLRLACLWPLLLGYRTLEAVLREPRWLDPDVVVRVPKKETKRLLIGSAFRALSNRSLDALMTQCAQAARAACIPLDSMP